MTLLATVLYEDTMLPGAGGSYPLHDLVMRFVEDQINGQTWRLQKLISKNARKGIGNVLKDIEKTSLLAGSGELFLLVDRDEIAAQVQLPHSATDDCVVEELRRRSDAPSKLHPFFLYRNLEDLLRHVQACDPSLLPGTVTSALNKNLNDRDIVLNRVKKPTYKELRNCIARTQTGIRDLAASLAKLVPSRAASWP